MSRTIDLMPHSARARAGRRQTRRRWICAYAVATAFVVAIAGAGRLRTISLERELASAQREAQREAEQTRAVLEIGSELLLVTERIEQHARLAPGPSVREVLAAVGRAAPASVTLTSVSYDLRRQTSAAEVRAQRRAGADTPRTGARVDIAGVAHSDTDIVRFITDIERSGVFESASLEFSRPVRIRNADAREFRVALVTRIASVEGLARAEGPR